MPYKAAGRCSECGAKLVNADGSPRPAGTKTCTPACRNKRARRIKRQQLAGAKSSKFEPEHQEIAAATRGEVTDVAHEVMKEELRPVVREAMTADVLGGIDSLIKLTPRAIELLQQQMESSDETIAQRAVTLLMRYTLGNPSVAPPPTHVAPAPMTVTFNLPRPGDTTAGSSDVEELRECNSCHVSKPDGDFVGASDRCVECFEQMKHKVTERLG